MATLYDIDFEGSYPPTDWSEQGTVGNIGTSTAEANSGTTSLHVLSASAASAWIRETTNTGNLFVVRFYFRLHVAPSGTCSIVQFDNAQGNIYLRVLNTRALRLTMNATNFTGPVLNLDQWYRIDLKVDTSASPATVAWQVDGSTTGVTQGSLAQTAATMTAINVGLTTSVTLDAYFDDIKITNVAGDYPLGSIFSSGTASAITATGTGAAGNVSTASALYDVNFEGAYPPTNWLEQGTVANVGTSTLQSNSPTTSLRVVNATATTAWIRQTASTGTLFVLRSYIRLHTTPSGVMSIVQFDNVNGPIYLRLTTARVIRVTMNTTNFDGPVLNLDQWYRVEMRVNTSGATATVDWQVAGVAQTQATRAQATASMTAIHVGVVTSVTTDIYFDDLKISNVSADYPFGTAGAVTTTVSAITASGTGTVTGNTASVRPGATGATGTGYAVVGSSQELDIASLPATGTAGASTPAPQGIASAITSALGATGTGSASNAQVKRTRTRFEFPRVVQTMETALRTSHTPIVRVQFLEGDLASVSHIVPMRVISGSVNMDRKREVGRQATVTLANDDRVYSPVSPTSLVWPGRIMRVERGVILNGVEEYVSLITGLLASPAQSYGDSSITFTVWSRLRLLDRQFATPVTFDAGTALGTIIRSICETGGLGTNDAFYDIDDDGRTLPVVRTFDLADNLLHAVTQLCFDNGLDGPYDDGDGKVIVRPFSDPSAGDVAWTFAPGTLSVLTGISWSLDERSPTLYNRQVVVGVAPDRYEIRGEWRDLNTSSPTYNPVDGTGPLGDLPAPPYVSTDIHTEDVATAVAQHLGIEHALADLPVRAEAVPIPMLAPRDVVTFSAGDLDVTARIDSLSIPLGPGDMTLQAQGVRSLVAS